MFIYILLLFFSELSSVMGDYDRIHRMCQKRGELWEDPDFPATQSSVFYHQKPPFQFVWKRPKVGKIFETNQTNEIHNLCILYTMLKIENSPHMYR